MMRTDSFYLSIVTIQMLGCQVFYAVSYAAGLYSSREESEMLVRMLLICAIAWGAIAPLDVAAKDGATWRKHRVVVKDYTPDEWKPYVADMVIAFNAMLPKRAPRLVYEAQPETPCKTLKRKRGRGQIAVCTGAFIDNTVLVAKNGVIRSALIQLFPETMPTHRHGFVCHEMMHAVTDAPDDYSYPHPETSCVLGDANFPGKWDAAYARKVYNKARHR